MSEPRLSGTQRAYLFNRDKFLAGLEERATRLFESGYRVSETNRVHVFVVACPHAKGEHIYFVDALADTCTCPFYTRQTDGEPLTEDGSILACKHIRGLPKLVRQVRLAYLEAGDLVCGYRLWAHWLAALTAKARKRTNGAYVPKHAFWPDGTPVTIVPEESADGIVELADNPSTRKETHDERAGSVRAY